MTTPGTLSDAWADDQEIDFLPPKPAHPSDAVDRVAQELVRIYSLGVSWDGASESLRAEWRKFARRVLDAAGLHEAVAQPVAVPAWQPISTAPKDGRDLILLLTPSKFPQVAYSNTWWMAGFSVECKPTHWMPLPAAPTQEPT